MNPGPPAPKTGGQRFLLAGQVGAAKIWQGVTPDHGTRFKYSEEALVNGATVSRILVENNRLVLEFGDQDKLLKFVELLKMLGVTQSIERKEIKIRYDEKFREYLEKDRDLAERTVRDYMNYLRKLNGKTINYDLYLEISGNKWMIKCIRLYLDYLYKRNEISWEELQKLKSIFKVKKRSNISNHKINEEELVITLYDERLKEPELLVFELLLYSGVRFSETIKLINEFDESKLECFEQHCRYGLFWTRGRKRCDWVFIPRDLIEKLRKYKGRYRGRKFHSLTRYFEKKYKVNVKLFRKMFYRVCRQVSDKEVCDFIESRISKLSIGDLHYDDLLSRADRDYPQVIKRIKNLIEETVMLMSEGIPAKEGGEIVEIRVGDMVFKPEDLEDENYEDEKDRDVWEFNLEEELESLNK